MITVIYLLEGRGMRFCVVLHQNSRGGTKNWETLLIDDEMIIYRHFIQNKYSAECIYLKKSFKFNFFIFSSVYI